MRSNEFSCEADIQQQNSRPTRSDHISPTFNYLQKPEKSVSLLLEVPGSLAHGRLKLDSCPPSFKKQNLGQDSRRFIDFASCPFLIDFASGYKIKQ